jgi:chaperone required for assembly of F1-ATPase
MRLGEGARKRFYRTATVAQKADGFAVELDGRPLRTPAARPLLLPTRPLAEAIAAEWDAQGEDLKPATLRLTGLANSAIDGVQGREAEIIGEIVRYGGSDLLCYRAASPAGLAAKQAALWDPVLEWSRNRLGVFLATTEGVKFCEQSPASLEALAAHLARLDAFQLIALLTMTGLAGSALVAIAVAENFLPVSEAWATAHVDEDWQIAQWGEDYEAKQRGERRFQEFEAAARFYELSTDRPAEAPKPGHPQAA